MSGYARNNKDVKGIGSHNIKMHFCPVRLLLFIKIRNFVKMVNVEFGVWWEL